MRLLRNRRVAITRPRMRKSLSFRNLDRLEVFVFRQEADLSIVDRETFDRDFTIDGCDNDVTGLR